MRFSVTERGTYERCERKAILSSKNGMHLTPLQTPISFATGSMLHRAHQLWITDPSTALSFHALTAANEAIDKFKTNYRAVVGASPGDHELSTLYEATEFVTAMCDNYAIKYGTPLPSEYKFLSAEQKISIVVEETRTGADCTGCDGTGHVEWPAHWRNEVVGGEWVNAGSRTCSWCDGSGDEVHTLEGTLDALTQHIPTGRVDPLERKSYNQRPKENSLRYNDQFMAYRWLVSQLQLSPIRPHVLYDGMWRRNNPPRGRLFDDLFLRIDLECNQDELDEFERHLPRQLNEMAALYTHSDPLSHARTHRPWMGCGDCAAFEKLCISITRNEDYASLINSNYTQRTDDVELETEVTE